MDLISSGEPVTPALFSYSHENNMGSSVLIGDVYRGASYPPLYRGTLFYTDYNRRQIRFVAIDRFGQVASSQLVVGPVGYLTQISRDPKTGDLYAMQIGSDGPASISALFRLVFKGYGPGPVPGAYTVESLANGGGCIEALPPTAETQVQGLEARPCGGAPSQRFAIESVGGDSYALRADGSTRRWTASSDDTESSPLRLDDPRSGSTQRFHVYPLGPGFQLIGESSERCVTVATAGVSNVLSMQSCDDVPAQIFRLVLTNNRPPELEAVVAQSGTLGQAVNLQLSARDPDGQDLTFFATGLPDTLSIDPQRGMVMGQLSKPGTFNVAVRVSDGQLEASTSFVWTVRDNLLPDVVISAPVEGRSYTPGEVVQFAGTAVDHRGVELPAYRLSWELIAHHNEHVHFGGLPSMLGNGGELLIEDHGDNTSLELCLSATDDDGRVNKACRLLPLREAEYTIDSAPTGLTIVWDVAARETPFTVQTHVGGTRDISAPITQVSSRRGSPSATGAMTAPRCIRS